jgi:hypothetical protein
MNSQVPKLTDDELTAYNATFETIHSEILKMKGIREDLDRLNLVKWEKPNPKIFDSVTTADGQNWKAYALLLPLPKARVLLCRQTGEWAVIQQLDSKSVYAQANGSTEILLKGNDVRELVAEYTAQAEHTLKSWLAIWWRKRSASPGSSSPITIQVLWFKRFQNDAIKS